MTNASKAAANSNLSKSAAIVIFFELDLVFLMAVHIFPLLTNSNLRTLSARAVLFTAATDAACMYIHLHHHASISLSSKVSNILKTVHSLAVHILSLSCFPRTVFSALASVHSKAAHTSNRSQFHLASRVLVLTHSLTVLFSNVVLLFRTSTTRHSFIFSDHPVFRSNH